MNEHEVPSLGLSSENESRVLPGVGILLARSVFYIIAAAVIVIGVWSAFTKADVVVSAAGSLVVQGEPVRVTASEQGMVVRVAVSVGQKVKEGDTLLELDPFRHSTDVDAMKAELAALRIAKTRYDDAVVRVNESIELTEKELELAGESETIIASQAATFKKLSEENVFSTLEAQQKQREHIEAKARIARLKGDLNSKERDLAQNRMLASEKDSRANGIAAKLKHLTEAHQRMVIKAPVAGTIASLGVKHPGSVMRTDAAAAVILPDNVPLLAFVRIPNASMRRLTEGMPVRMRLDAFPHQDYGFISGKLIEIEPDSDAAGTYGAWLSLDAEEIKGQHGVEQLRPGLKVSADIIIDRKSLLELVLAPLKKLGTPITVSE